MRGLPDSAIYGTYKRASRGRRRNSAGDGGLFEVAVELYFAYKRYKARRSHKNFIR
jgi:hypothetical protein